MIYDYLIVGHGLAGIALCQKIMEFEKTVMVFDHPKLNSASSVAGGLYNPITGRKMVKTWNADKIFPVIEPFYKKLEKVLESKFLYDIGIYRPFLNVEEQNEWQGKAGSRSFKSYINEVYTTSQKNFHVNDPFGGLLLKNAGYLDTKSLIEGNKKRLLDKGIYQELVFKEDKLIEEERFLSYDNFKFKSLIFCNGYNLSESGCFNWLPFRPVKGEILNMTMEHEIETIQNRGVFILPKNDATFKVGSTYNWKEINNDPSEQGKKQIQEKLNVLYNGRYEVNGMEAGIRPATKDRRPFIGVHPKNNRVGIFNGFGSKGVSLIPYYSNQYISYLELGAELDNEVNICRYF